MKTAFKKENGLFGDIETLGYDLDRVYLEANNTEFIIRMWNIYDTPKGCRITWTLFKDVEDEDGGSHGEEISYGESLVGMSE